jgi:hypothetical protein
MRNRLTFLLCLVPLSICAQTQTQTQADATGSVSGHVYCADTNQPARFATVLLQPPPHKFVPTEQPSPSPIARTALDGSFHFTRVKAGTYYLLAEQPGYVSPIAKIPSIDMNNPDQAVVENMEKALNKITVAANKDTTAEIELERGAAIAGTIHYDDGSPASSVEVSLFRQEKDRKLAAVTLQLADRMGIVSPKTTVQTDDRGNFRISGLPAGKYVAETAFPTTSVSYAGLFGGPTLIDVRNNESAALRVYSGNVFRSKDAKAIEIVAGEERDGADITIPLLGLHSINGSVVALSDGHPVNMGNILLLYADDQTTLRTVDLDQDGRFSLAYVPEGEYILRVGGAADTVKETKHDGPMHYETDKPVRTYGSVDQPIILHADVPSLIINVPEKSHPQKPSP